MNNECTHLNYYTNMKVFFGYMQGFGRDAARHVSTFARMVCVHPETKKSENHFHVSITDVFW
jgi:hypothetical protein